MTGLAVRRRRGEPVAVMALIGAAWVGLRVVLWEAPIGGDAALARGGMEKPAPPRQASQGPTFAETTASAHRAAGLSAPTSRAPAFPPPSFEPTPGGVVAQIPARPPAALAIPSDVLSPPATTASASPIADRASPRAGWTQSAPAKRWRVDGWMAWRPGSRLPQVAAGAPLALAYGGTQGGAVARFDLGAGDRRPQVYLRAVHAPDRPSQSDLAAGAGLRPLGALPLRIQGEARVTRTAEDTFVRPAILAVTEMPPVDLPLGLRGEAYAQAGWVGGRYATGFVDGQARVDRKVISAGPADVRLGGGAWGGAQKYVSRLDVGPSLTLHLNSGPVPARLSLDYRKRVAGRAHPGDGIAVTLSTGF